MTEPFPTRPGATGPERPAVLLVDDRVENLVALEAVLQPLEVDVVAARSGPEALRAVLERDFAVILLDVQMPDMDGFEVARYIRSRERSARVPVVFLTAISDTSAHVLQGYGSGAIDYIVKPVDPFVLRSKVSVFVELQSIHRELVRQVEERSAHESLAVAQQAGESGIWDWDLADGRTYWSPELADLYGVPAGEAPDVAAWIDLVHPVDRDRMRERLQRLLAEGDVWNEEFRIVHPVRGERWLVGKGRLRRDARGRPTRFIGINVDITDRKHAEENLRRSEQRFRTIADAAPMVVFTTDAAGRWTYANDAWTRLSGIGAEAALGTGWRAALHGDDRARALSRYRRAIREGRTVELTTRLHGTGVRETWLLLRAEPQLGPGGRVTGYLGSGVDISEQKTAEERQELLARLGALLDADAGLAERVDSLVRFVEERLPVRCAVELYDEAGNTLGRSSATDDGRADGPGARFPEHVSRAVAQAVSTRMPVELPARGASEPPGARDASAAVVPIVLRDRVLGSLVAVSTAPGPLPVAHLATLELVCARAALALANARLYEREHEISTELQRAMLPSELPRRASVRFEARYLPSTAELEVGGDWYDAFELPDGRLVCCVGDVVGSGIRAASAMGQLRSAVRALAAVCEGPAEILERLDAFAEAIEGGPMTTIVYAEIDPDSGVARYACAGHPPPLLLDGGTARFLDDGRSSPLACLGATERVEAVETLRAGSCLVFYTDGLVERRGELFDVGLDRLADAAGRLTHGSPGTSFHVDDLVAEMLRGAERRDDVCVLCLRHLSTRSFRHGLRADPSELARLRAGLREWLGAAGVDESDTFDVVLAVGEACSNAIEHGHRLDGRSAVAVHLDMDEDGHLSAVVRDAGSWKTPSRAHERGRGLPVMRACMESVEIEHTKAGTAVRMERRLRLGVFAT